MLICSTDNHIHFFIFDFEYISTFNASKKLFPIHFLFIDWKNKIMVPDRQDIILGGRKKINWLFPDKERNLTEPINASIFSFLKGYLGYKTITTQNVSSEAQIKNFFISKKNYVSFSRHSSFCIFNHPMIYRICDVTMSISTWDNFYLWIDLLNHNSWSHQTWSVDRYKQGQ